MKPIIDWDIETHQYALMEKGGSFQWRWLPPYPEESPDGAYSPLFDSIEAARAWHDCKHPAKDAITIDGWKAITPNA